MIVGMGLLQEKITEEYIALDGRQGGVITDTMLTHLSARPPRSANRRPRTIRIANLLNTRPTDILIPALFSSSFVVERGI